MAADLRCQSWLRNSLIALDQTDTLLHSFLLSAVLLRSFPIRLSSPPSRKYPRLYILRRSSPERRSNKKRSIFSISHLFTIETAGQTTANCATDLNCLRSGQVGLWLLRLITQITTVLFPLRLSSLDGKLSSNLGHIWRLPLYRNIILRLWCSEGCTTNILKQGPCHSQELQFSRMISYS